MAKVGGGAAYQQLRVPENGTLQVLGNLTNVEARKRAAEKLENERDRVRKQKRTDDFFSKRKNLPALFKTGNQTENDIINYLAEDFVSKSVENARLESEAWNSGDETKARQYRSKYNTMLSEVSSVNKQIESIKKILEEQAKNPELYNEYDTEGLKVFDALANENAIMFMDDEGKVKVALQKDTNIDTNNDGEISEDEKETARNLISSNPKSFEIQELNLNDLPNALQNRYKNVDIVGKKGLVAQIASTIGGVSIENTEGMFRLKQSGWEVSGMTDQQKAEREESLNDLIKSQVNQGDVFASVWHHGMGKPVKDNARKAFQDPSKVKEAQDWMVQKVKDFYDSEKSKILDPSAVSRQNARDRNKKDDDSPLSNLHFDAVRFKEGDYTGLLGRHETEIGEEINIREVIPAPDGNYVIAVTDSGERIEIPNTKRGFLEFKIRGKSEYKGLTPEKVLQKPPIPYRKNIIKGSPVANIANDLFNEEGKPTVDDEEFLKRLNEAFGIKGEDNNTLWGNSLRIYGKDVDTSNKESFISTLNAALGNKEKLNW